MYHSDSLPLSLFVFLVLIFVVAKVMKPVSHTAHYIRNQREGWWVVVWPREVVDSIVDFAVWVSCAFGAELPDTPIFAMFAVEEGY
jgi:hypothetical protein